MIQTHLPRIPREASREGVGGASGSRATGLLDALGPRVEQLRQRVFVGQLQQFGRHGSVDLLQEAVGSCWGGRGYLALLKGRGHHV